MGIAADTGHPSHSEIEGFKFELSHFTIGQPSHLKIRYDEAT
jgi:hypothetical protein